MRKQSTSEVEPSQELLEVRLATSCRKVGNEKKARPVRGTIGKKQNGEENMADRWELRELHASFLAQKKTS